MKALINKSIINQVLKINTNKFRNNISKLVKEKERYQCTQRMVEIHTRAHKNE